MILFYAAYRRYVERVQDDEAKSREKTWYYKGLKVNKCYEYDDLQSIFACDSDSESDESEIEFV